MCPRSRFVLCTVVAVLVLSDCTQPAPNTTMGCRDGNRSQCVAEIATGAHFACALLNDHTVWCWGRNDESQLGYASTDLCPRTLPSGQTQSVACHTFPFQVVGLDHVTHVAAGDAFACAVSDDATVKCWGANEAGQLGNAATLPSMQPVAVQGLTGATALALGARHACAITSTATMCWGANDRLQLGAATNATCTTVDGPVACSSTAIAATAVVGATVITAGAAHTCARTMDGHVQCWGDNQYGQSGGGAASATATMAPVMVLAGTQPVQSVHTLAAGAHHTCALRDDGAVFCWGRNDHAQLGVAPAGIVPAHCAAACSPTAVAVAALPGAPSPMGAMDGGVVHGSDAGVARDASVGPTRDGGSGAVPRAIAAGATFSCGRLDDGTVMCWGDDTAGQLGDGEGGSATAPPARVLSGPGAARNNPLQHVDAMTAGGATVCARIDDGSARCWGSSEDGALGIGSTAPQAGPVPVTW